MGLMRASSGCPPLVALGIRCCHNPGTGRSCNRPARVEPHDDHHNHHGEQAKWLQFL
ncbi:hypothetical protein SXCC_04771 [Gluconacetobacter sp. SXCC-1]|nr:hypothetical protein SXCC_04771 [Gluconacetobacter sp. SXCC-1]